MDTAADSKKTKKKASIKKKPAATKAAMYQLHACMR